jgi:hypothetical protein
MEYYSENKPTKCPSCGSPNLVRILYGMPSYEAFLDSQAGKIILGGCVISGNDPKWGCTKCDAKIYKKMSVDP